MVGWIITFGAVLVLTTLSLTVICLVAVAILYVSEMVFRHTNSEFLRVISAAFMISIVVSAVATVLIALENGWSPL